MNPIDISKLKNRWLGSWNPGVQYKTNDVVQWRGSSYVCIQDIPSDKIVVADTSVSTNMYMSVPPNVVLKSIDPTDSAYWIDMSPGMKYKKAWAPRSTYTQGDIVELGGDLYICIQGEVRNTYVTDSTYWTKIFENADRDQRYVSADFINQQPLGWTRNNGDQWWGSGNMGYHFGFIGCDGSAYVGGARYRGTGMGANANNNFGQSGWATPGFTFVDWLSSTDKGGAGPLTTPDGQPPKLIQWACQAGDTTAVSGGVSLWLFNNGEVYSSGYNAHGQLGITSGDTTERYWPIRVTANETTDWWGNTIPKTFNQTKIIKVCLSGTPHWNEGPQSCYAIGDDGSVWSWGYNGYGQLGLGPESTTTNSIGQAETNQTIPKRIPQQHFDNKKIVDIMAFGGRYGYCFALDEDGFLWSWGLAVRGGTGLADRHADTGYTIGRQFTPVRISIDWNRHGGMKKLMSMNSVGNYEFTYILDGDGYIWYAGQSNVMGQASIASVTNRNGDESTPKFTRLDKNWFGEHKIENFWMVGSNYDYNVYFREKGTGLLYVMGTNQEGQMGTQNNHRYSDASWSPFPTVIRNVRYPKEVVTFFTGSNTYANTVCVVSDDGECHGSGLNSYGSLGFGFGGDSYPGVAEVEDQSSNNLFRRIPMPPGTTITNINSWGTPGYDASIWRSDSGGILIAGFDGENEGNHMLQGHINTRRYRQTVGNPGSYHAYHMHSYPG